MGKKIRNRAQETPFEQVVIKEDKPHINRNYVVPCKGCYKRDSCFITQPRNEICASFESGTPWSESYNKSLPAGFPINFEEVSLSTLIEDEE